jgi:hypothetical protein
MLCDKCQKREATVHHTHFTSVQGNDVTCVAGDDPKEGNLCQECYEASNPTEAQEVARATAAGCQYCGGTPYSGGPDSLAKLSGAGRWRFLCQRCTNEYYGFLRRKMPGFRSTNVTKEQIDEIRKHDFPAVLRELDEHMKLWVKGRDSK